MKTIIRLTRPLFLILLALAAFTTSTRAQEVSIPDPGLNDAIRQTLQKPSGPLTQQDLLSLTNLNARNRHVSRIVGLEVAGNLVSLDLQINLGGNLLTQLSVPAGLTHLVGLFVTGNLLTTLTLPPDMTQVIGFGFLGNPLTTFVLPETLAATNLAGDVATLPSQGVSVFTYPLTIQLISPRRTPGSFEFTLTGPPGLYSILGSTDLTSWNASGAITNARGSAVFRDSAVPVPQREFFRSRSAP